MPMLTDLNELKVMLEIACDDNRHDKLLNFYVEYASDLIEEYLDRRGLFYQVRTEYYDGSGTNRLLLRSRPVRITPTIEVYVDENGGYGQIDDTFGSETALTYGDDFYLKTDGPSNASSRCGILIRNAAYWPKRIARQYGLLSPFVAPNYGNIKVVYGGGYTVDDLPAAFRFACNLLVARIRYLMPLGIELASESYEERHISTLARQRDYLMGLVKPLLFTYRNWNF